ncbi:polyphosphate kinase 2 [Paraglaciecola aquimarina]|uniref:ADP/GDP-polyphosphate phosphotransferase n=1 Tax=Paraglaciecola algarum TaxID=3050085 RepID=A0ABS9D7R0_9ALTE|nr:polyphosphate kinase 2 [Paraglaciecola sp. G1-23]MCF2948959.1 polyphosphate kinase 2 [Paraglaciecola sp. G1-23]
MKKQDYQATIVKLQTELVKLQEWVQTTGAKVVVVFEGRDAAGKGGVIKTITSRLNPRIVKVVALGKPTEKERSQWYFQRYVNHLPAGGEIVLFDRSWYNRAGVEKVMGFCSDDEYQEFLTSCPEFEKMLIGSGIKLIKYWFSVSQQKQEERFMERLNNPLKRWKFSDMDLVSRSKWNEYSVAKDEMLKHTDTNLSPWYNIEADDKKAARVNCISHLLSLIDYQYSEQKSVKLPKVAPSVIKRLDKNSLRTVADRYGQN